MFCQFTSGLIILNNYLFFVIRYKYFTKSYDDTEKLKVTNPIKKLSKLTLKNAKLIIMLTKSKIQTMYLLGILKVILIVFPKMFKTIQTHITCGNKAYKSLISSNLITYLILCVMINFSSKFITSSIKSSNNTKKSEKSFIKHTSIAMVSYPKL